MRRYLVLALAVTFFSLPGVKPAAKKRPPAQPDSAFVAHVNGHRHDPIPEQVPWEGFNLVRWWLWR